MQGSWVLIILILISSLPVGAVYVWFRLTKYSLSSIKFLLALLTGAAAFIPALFLQNILTFSIHNQGRWTVLYEFFIRIAFTEELSRLFMLVIFFLISGLFSKEDGFLQPPTFRTVSKGTAIGLIAGLGFAILENARYAADGMEIGIVLLRLFTTAMHGACGSRIGAASVILRTNPIQAFLKILTATAIHGVYNLMTMPGFSLLAAIFIAVSALITAILTIRKTPESEPSVSSNSSAHLDKINEKP